MMSEASVRSVYSEVLDLLRGLRNLCMTQPLQWRKQVIYLPVLPPQFSLLWEHFDLSLGACVRDNTKQKRVLCVLLLVFQFLRLAFSLEDTRSQNRESMCFAVGHTWVHIPVLPSTIPLNTLFKFAGPVFSAVNLRMYSTLFPRK